MADTDLTQTIIPYLDRHLVFPLLNHLLETSTFPREDVERAQYELAKDTNMVDYAVMLYGQVYGEDADPPEGMY
jgi:translation initiation factor 3 subunit E